MAKRIDLELTDEQLDTLIEWRQSVNDDEYFVMFAEPLLDTGVLKVSCFSGDRATKVYAILQAALNDVRATASRKGQDKSIMSERLVTALITAIIAIALAAGVILALAVVGYIAKVVIGYAVADERIAVGLFVSIAAIALVIVMEERNNRWN